jgi:beta-lysine 5,6-aminomutase beta subunit
MDKNPKKTGLVRAYGDRTGDGVIQVSFTLPVPFSPRAREAGRIFASKMGLSDITISASESAGDGFTFFVVYGRTAVSVDFDSIEVPVVDNPVWSRDRINGFIRDRLGRKIIVTGACTGTDAHTVGIDAIMNMKGFAGDYGLERYQWFEAHNLGAQIGNADFIEKSIGCRADVMLLSQVVTQRNVHIDNAQELVRIAEEKGVRSSFIMILGGPRIDHKLALSLGFDAGFGSGTRPSEVASYILFNMVKRLKGEELKG